MVPFPTEYTPAYRRLKAERLAYLMGSDTIETMIAEYYRMNCSLTWGTPGWPAICMNNCCEFTDEVACDIELRMCPECKTPTLRDVFDILGMTHKEPVT